jgi:hypothetical protein
VPLGPSHPQAPGTRGGLLTVKGLHLGQGARLLRTSSRVDVYGCRDGSHRPTRVLAQRSPHLIPARTESHAHVLHVMPVRCDIHRTSRAALLAHEAPAD